MRMALEVTTGPHKGMRRECDGHETFFVGRSERCALRLDRDAHFSRMHFVIEALPPRAFLRDLGSSNGTFVNGRKVTETFLSDGDEISGGQTRIRFHAQTGASGTPNPLAPIADYESGSGAIPFAPPGYELSRRLGRGGMGEVYLARHLASGREVAVKVILPDAAATEKGVRQFLREASVMSKLVHPRIVQFHEIGLAQGRLFVVMEHVEAVKLKDWLNRRAPAYRLAAAVSIAVQALEGLGFAHRQGMVHRDVKPDNLLVGGDVKKTLQVKIADFGLAKSYEHAGLSGMTHVGDISGTMAFMAPEQVLDFRMVKPCVDIYSMGATLYWLLSGHSPHEFPHSKKDRLLAIVEEEPVPLLELVPTLPIELAAIVHLALSKEPDRRFGDADTFRRALRPFAAASGA